MPIACSAVRQRIPMVCTCTLIYVARPSLLQVLRATIAGSARTTSQRGKGGEDAVYLLSPSQIRIPKALSEAIVRKQGSPSLPLVYHIDLYTHLQDLPRGGAKCWGPGFVFKFKRLGRAAVSGADNLLDSLDSSASIPSWISCGLPEKFARLDFQQVIAGPTAQLLRILLHIHSNNRRQERTPASLRTCFIYRASWQHPARKLAGPWPSKNWASSFDLSHLLLAGFVLQDSPCRVACKNGTGPKCLLAQPATSSRHRREGPHANCSGPSRKRFFHADLPMVKLRSWRRSCGKQRARALPLWVVGAYELLKLKPTGNSGILESSDLCTVS